eukprot:m.1637692 g.1637692  ORF g.1637692 m.1637692 type:complete len:52 (+) comp26015_c0_seq1:550-705(+)
MRKIAMVRIVKRYLRPTVNPTKNPSESTSTTTTEECCYSLLQLTQTRTCVH